MRAQSVRVRESFSGLLKKWPSVFLEERSLSEGFWLESLGEIIQENSAWTSEPVKLFMQPYDNALPDSSVKEVVSFCQGAQICQLKGSPESSRQAAWLDDTCSKSDPSNGSSAVSMEGTQSPSYGSPKLLRSTVRPVARVCRRYEGHLTAAMLRRHLRQKVR
jgi:hypothetical protein